MFTFLCILCLTQLVCNFDTFQLANIKSLRNLRDADGFYSMSNNLGIDLAMDLHTLSFINYNGANLFILYLRTSFMNNSTSYGFTYMYNSYKLIVSWIYPSARKILSFESMKMLCLKYKKSTSGLGNQLGVAGL